MQSSETAAPKKKKRISRDYSVFAKGQRIPPNIRRLIEHHLEQATFPTKYGLARAIGVSYETVNRIYQKSPEVQAKFAEAMERKLNAVEEAGFEMAINGKHPIAKEKMIEFLLTHHKPEVYGDNASNRNAVAAMPKIIIPIEIKRTQELPTVAATISLEGDGASPQAERGETKTKVAEAEVIDVS